MDRNGLEMSLNSRPIVRLLHPMFVCQYCRKLVLVRRTAYNRPSRDDRNHTRRHKIEGTNLYCMICTSTYKNMYIHTQDIQQCSTFVLWWRNYQNAINHPSSKGGSLRFSNGIGMQKSCSSSAFQLFSSHIPRPDHVHNTHIVKIPHMGSLPPL